MISGWAIGISPRLNNFLLTLVRRVVMLILIPIHNIQLIWMLAFILGTINSGEIPRLGMEHATAPGALVAAITIGRGFK